MAIVIVALAGCAQLRESTSSRPRFIIFFRHDSVAIFPAVQTVLDAAIARIKSSRPSMIEIGTDADQPATSNFNPRLAEPRMKTVETALISAGVDPSLIRRVSLPNIEAPLGPTADRRVEISLVRSRTAAQSN